MKGAKPVAGLLALLGALALGDACAQQAAPTTQPKEHADRTPQAQEEQAGNAARQPVRKPTEAPVKGQPQGQPVAKPVQAKQQGKQEGKQQGKPMEPADSQRTRSGKPPPPRRNVPANVATMPQPTAPQAYGPVLHDMAPQNPMPTPAPPGLPNPAPINDCTGGQCRDAAGNTYNTGVGSAAISSDGRTCNRVGNTIQCF